MKVEVTNDMHHYANDRSTNSNKSSYRTGRNIQKHTFKADNEGHYNN